MEDAYFAYLKEITKNIYDIIDHVNKTISNLSKQELAAISQQSLTDLRKVQTGVDNLQKAIDKLVITDLPSLQADPSNLTAKLITIRHDLRTPVNAIKGYSELIIEELEMKQLIPLTIKFASIPEFSTKILQQINNISEAPPASAPVLPEDMFSNTPNPIAKKTESKTTTIKISSRAGSLLIVDDLEENRELLSDWLSQKRYQFNMASGGEEALAFLEKHPNTDIVLLDIMMPGMDGFEVLHRIKADPQLSNIIVIMISALEEMDSIVHCIKEGADDYLVKPFNAYLLEARIFACLEKKRLRDSERAYLAILQDELSVAQKIQSSMLPVRIPVSDSYSIYGRSIPAKEVGGDFYDWYELKDGRLGFCIGDISGKGISAALFMAVSRTVLNTLVNIQSSAAQSMSEANALLLKNNDALMFATLFYGILDIQTSTLTFVNAGHWQPILIKKSGEQITLEGASGPAVGVIEDIKYIEFSTAIEADDTLFLYTDGVTEAVNGNYEPFGLSGLQKSLKKCLNQSPKKYVESVVHDVLSFTGEEDIFDDISCLALHINALKKEER